MASPGIATFAAKSPNVYTAFSGSIDTAGLQRIMNAAGVAVQNGFTNIHLLFESTGGAVGDGICLYNFLRTLPLKLTIYNGGTVASIAAIAFLGAQSRKASANAIFMIHRTYTPSQSASAKNLPGITKSLSLDDERTEDILRQNIKLQPSHWDEIAKGDLFLSAQEALSVGLIDEIADFVPAPGALLSGI